MMTTKGEKAKKDVILDLFKNKEDLVLDEKFQFSFNHHVLYVLSNDLEMYLNSMKLLKSKIPYNRDLYQIAYDQRQTLFTSNKLKKERAFSMSLVKCFFMQSIDSSKLKQYVFKPIYGQYLDYSEHRLFDVYNNHLEYSPMVNQRVFPIGGQEKNEESASGHKEILNVQFKETYTKFLHMIMHQDFNLHLINLTPKHRLQLAFFLQLQDRTEESIVVFKTVNMAELQKGGNDFACQVTYDYMRAYFDFFVKDSDNAEFKDAREVVSKYSSDYPL